MFFNNPLGLAAGFDKNAQAIEAIMRLGFGFCEIGTVTPKPQAGNMKPRLFRLAEDFAIVNRMGFNNSGHDVIYENIEKSYKGSGVLGINIGANKDSYDRIGDYVQGLQKFYTVAHYFTINISSPNTPGLRGLQERENLEKLLELLSQERKKQKSAGRNYVPIFLKIAPDLSEESLEEIAEIFLKSDFDGLVVCNTTIERKHLKDRQQIETGGLSGRPLFEKSTIILAKMRRYIGKERALIGVGGVEDSQSFLEKVKAGADLVQLYSALIYKGPLLAADILRKVSRQMDLDGVKNLADYRDLHTEKWANRELL